MLRNKLFAEISTRTEALRLAGAAFLTELVVVLVSGPQLHDYEASAMWAVLIPLGILTIVVGIPALLPGSYNALKLAVGALLYLMVGGLVGYALLGFEDSGEPLFETREALIASFAWPVAPFLAMLQAMQDGLGWYS